MWNGIGTHSIGVIHFQAVSGDGGGGGGGGGWGPVQGEGVDGATGEGGSVGRGRWSSSSTKCCLLTELTPANGIAGLQPKLGGASWLKLVVEFKLFLLPTIHFYKVPSTLRHISHITHNTLP